MDSTTATLVFSGIPAAQVESLSVELRETLHSPLYGLDHVEVFRHSDGLVLRLNRGERGYTFCRRPSDVKNDVDIFRAFLHNPVAVQYTPITYELTVEGENETANIVKDILASYEAKHGRALVEKIDWLVWHSPESMHTFLILLLPREIVKRLMQDEGGRLTTFFHGRVGTLRKIKALAPVLPEEIEDETVVKRGLVTEYGKGAYMACYAIHQSVVREVCRHPGEGIAIGPIGVWSP